MAGLTIYPTMDDLAKGVAEKILAWVQALDGTASIVLAGGSTPERLYSYIASLDKGRTTNWRHVHFFWGDERCVPPDSKESNYRMANEAFLQALAIPSGNVHRIRGENDPEAEAQRYATEIRSVLPAGSDELPAFDVALLGVGEDGHTASLFPRDEALKNSRDICTVAVHPTTGQQRITLTVPTLLRTERLRFIVTGNAKARILKNVLDDKSGDTPAGMLLHNHEHAEIVADREASVLL